MRRLRAFVASLILMGLILPWVNVAATSLHLAADHHDVSGRDHDGTFRQAFHGHHHDDDASDHDHPLVGRDLSSLRSHLRQWIVFPATVPVVWTQSALSHPREFLALRYGGRRDHGPPGAASAQALTLRI